MQTIVVPGWIWLNLIILVAAAVFTGVKIATTRETGRERLEPKSQNP